MSTDAVDLTPDVLIAGTPRSGTTLVQRLVSELPGVSVSPETHFFTAHYRGMLNRCVFPLDEAVVRKELAFFSELPTSRGLEFADDDVIELLGGQCEAPSQLFGAITRSLTGSANLVGEKTPDHLRWWRPLTRSPLKVKFVFVVRDPRGVVASRMRAGWGATIPELLTARWRVDQQEILRAVRSLPPDRRVLIRYEDAASAPEEVRDRLAAFLRLDVTGGDRPNENPARLFPEWETWKARALEPVTEERIDAWRSVLPPEVAEYIHERCREELKGLGYDPPPSTAASTTLPPGLATRVLRMRFSRWRERKWIATRKV